MFYLCGGHQNKTMRRKKNTALRSRSAQRRRAEIAIAPISLKYVNGGGYFLTYLNSSSAHSLSEPVELRRKTASHAHYPHIFKSLRSKESNFVRPNFPLNQKFNLLINK